MSCAISAQNAPRFLVKTALIPLGTLLDHKTKLLQREESLLSATDIKKFS